MHFRLFERGGVTVTFSKIDKKDIKYITKSDNTNEFIRVSFLNPTFSWALDDSWMVKS